MPASNSYLPNKTHFMRGYLFMAGATFFWGLSATLGRAVFTGRLFAGGQALRPIDPLILAQSRTTIALLILLPIVLLKGRSSLRVRSSSHLLQFFLLGFSDWQPPTTSTISPS